MAGPDQALLRECVHCGFCLPSCPTYLLWGEEMDSPRGRIHLMQQLVDGAPLGEAMAEHFDRCIGCMACVTACPSGVRYDRLVEQTRVEVAARHRRPVGERLLRAAVFGLFPYPRRMRALAGPLAAYHRSGLAGPARRWLGPRLPGPLAAMQRLSAPPPRGARVPARTPAQGQRRAVVGLLTGCAGRVFFPQVNAATVRVLAAEGCEVVAPPGQGCCGALSVHAGREREARRFARRCIDTFLAAGVERVAVNAAGCGSVMKDYAALLADEPRYAEPAGRLAAATRDVAELLCELGPVAPRHPLPVTVAYQDPCHLAHAQGVRAQPRRLLSQVPGLVVRELAEPEICCGSGGVYNVLQPAAGRELGARKAARVLDSGAELLVTANPGCSLQLRAALADAGRQLPVVHTVELLDASLRGLGVTGLTGRTG